MNLLKFLFGTKNERELKKLWPIVRQINTLEEKLQAENLADEDFPKRTAELKARVAEILARRCRRTLTRIRRWRPSRRRLIRFCPRRLRF